MDTETDQPKRSGPDRTTKQHARFSQEVNQPRYPNSTSVLSQLHLSGLVQRTLSFHSTSPDVLPNQQAERGTIKQAVASLLLQVARAELHEGGESDEQ